MSKPDDRARAVGAANTLWFDGTALLSTNTDVEGFTDNLDAPRAGWEPRPADSRRAGRRWLGARYRLRADRARRRRDPRRQPHAGAGAGAARRSSAPWCNPVAGTAACRTARQGRPPRQHHVARHDRPAAACHRPRPTARPCGGGGPGLCAAGDAIAGGGPWPRAATADGLGCCCIRRSAGSSCGSACGRR